MMPIKRDDFSDDHTRGIVHMEAANFASLYAKRDGRGFHLGMHDDKFEYYFDRSAMRDAIRFFNRLIEIVEKD